MTAIFFILGLVLLAGGAELLVRGASQLAAGVGISPLVVGLTVVAFGTSAPELAISVQASLAGRGDLALGNVVGSNICNILLILGVSALLVPLEVDRQLVRYQVPLMIAVSVLIWLMAADGAIGRSDGLLLFTGLVAYLVVTVRNSRRQSQRSSPPAADHRPPAVQRRWQPGPRIVQLMQMIAGLTMLVWGSKWLVTGAVAIARALGLSELMIGLTIVAAGTSLPEIATSVLASLRGEREIAVGNAVGSNLFNMLMVLGVAGAVAPQGIPVPPEALALDIPLMTVVALACLPVFFTDYRIARWEGALFLSYYAAYTVYLILAARYEAWLVPFRLVMLRIVIPLTAIVLLALVAHWIRQRRTEIHPRPPSAADEPR